MARRHLGPALAGLAVSLAWIAAPQAQAAAWLPPVLVSDAGIGPNSAPQVAVDDRGDTFMAWRAAGGGVIVTKRPSGGLVFESRQPLDSGGPNALDLRLGVDGAGNAVVVWTTDSGRVEQARRGVNDSAFAMGPTVDSPGASKVRLAVNRSGEAVVGWNRGLNPSFEVDWALGSTTTAFGARVTAAPATSTGYTPGDVRINEAGDAAFVFTSPGSSGSTLLSSAYRVHGAALGGTPQTIVDQQMFNDGPMVALDEQGQAVAVWTTSASSGEVRASSRPAGSTGPPPWTSSTLLDATPGGPFSHPNVAFDSLGQALATWGSQNDMRTSTRPVGAQFPAPPGTLLGTNEQPADSALGSVVPGNSALLWRSSDSMIRAAIRPPGGLFGLIATLNEGGHTGVSPVIAVSSGGNVSAGWVDTKTAGAAVSIGSAVYDATAPVFDHSFSVPVSAFVGDSVGMNAPAFDDWTNPPTVIWDFGDGTLGFGPFVTHSYAAAGTYTVGVTASDGAGNSTSLSRAIAITTPPPPPPPPPPASPTRGLDFNASTVSGTVLVSTPAVGLRRAAPVTAHAAAAIAPPAGYTPFRVLGNDDNIPVGSILDATRGISQITMATNATGTATQTGKFSKGVFKTQQLKGSPLTTAVMMGGGNFKRECRKLGFAGKVSAARKRPSRRLFANVRGRFRTRGRHSTATVRGTQYLVKDSCTGTLTTVSKGSVKVFDLVKHRSRVVRAGHSYLARALRRKKH
jgi:PKD repeat protein